MRKSILFLCCCFGVFGLKLYAIDDPKYPDHPKVSLPFSSSNLPVVIIDLEERIAPKNEDRRVPATMKIIWNRLGEPNRVDETDSRNRDYNGSIVIGYRKYILRFF